MLPATLVTMKTVNVYNSSKKGIPLKDQGVLARVKFNSILDIPDQHTSHHIGITRLRRTGQYVLIHDTGSEQYAIVVDPETALDAVVQSDHLELLEESKFSILKKIAIIKGILQPEILDETTASDNILIRVSPARKQQIKEAAEAAGLSMTDYILSRLDES